MNRNALKSRLLVILPCTKHPRRRVEVIALSSSNYIFVIGIEKQQLGAISLCKREE